MKIASKKCVFPQKSTQRQRGFSLVEILLVLGIIATLSVGAFLIYKKVSSAAQINRAADQYTYLVAATQKFFGGRPYTGLSALTAVSAGIVEQRDLQSPWGTMGVLVSSDPKKFYVMFNDVPQDDCKKLLARLDTMAEQLHTDAGGYVKDASTAFNPLTSPAAGCGAGNNRIRAFPEKL